MKVTDEERWLWALDEMKSVRYGVLEQTMTIEEATSKHQSIIRRMFNWGGEFAKFAADYQNTIQKGLWRNEGK